MLKYFKEALILVVIIIVCVILGNIIGIFGGRPGLFSKDLVAIGKGIPIMLGMVAALAILATLWKHPAGKVVIVLVIVAIIVIAIIL